MKILENKSKNQSDLRKHNKHIKALKESLIIKVNILTDLMGMKKYTLSAVQKNKLQKEIDCGWFDIKTVIELISSEKLEIYEIIGFGIKEGDK